METEILINYFLSNQMKSPDEKPLEPIKINLEENINQTWDMVLQ